MNFTKGAIVGIVAGTILGAMNSDTINSMLKSKKREFRLVKRKLGI